LITKAVAPKNYLVSLNTITRRRDSVGEKRMLIVPVELVKKIDDNRGDTGQAEFIELLIDGQLKETKNEHQNYVTKEEFRSFEHDIKKLLKNFLEFFVSYGLELGKQSPKAEFEELTSKLQELENDLGSDSEKKKATIKWK
jgi:C-terminal processing protease CtpA/Prc